MLLWYKNNHLRMCCYCKIIIFRAYNVLNIIKMASADLFEFLCFFNFPSNCVHSNHFAISNTTILKETWSTGTTVCVCVYKKNKHTRLCGSDVCFWIRNYFVRIGKHKPSGRGSLLCSLNRLRVLAKQHGHADMHCGLSDLNQKWKIFLYQEQNTSSNLGRVSTMRTEMLSLSGSSRTVANGNNV